MVLSNKVFRMEMLLLDTDSSVWTDSFFMTHTSQDTIYFAAMKDTLLENRS